MNTQIDSTKIIREKRFQMRLEMDRSTVARYIGVLWTADRRNWRTENALPAIQIAKVGDSLFLVDGFHRLEAMVEFAGGAGRLGQIRADVVVATEKEALLLAARANLRNGLPLKKSEIRNAFRAYMDANGNELEDQSLKSYRAIAVDLGGLCSHMSVQRWMLAEYNNTAKMMSGDEGADKKNKKPRRDNNRNEWADASIRDVNNAYARFSGNPADQQKQWAVIGHMEEVLNAMRKEAGQEPEPKWMDGNGVPTDF